MNGTPEQGKTTPNFYSTTLALNNESNGSEAKTKDGANNRPSSRRVSDRTWSSQFAHGSALLLLPLVFLFVVSISYSY